MPTLYQIKKLLGKNKNYIFIEKQRDMLSATNELFHSLIKLVLPQEIFEYTNEADTTKILVNVFAGSERSVVEMRVGNNGGWIPLEHVNTIDPECLRMHQLSPYLQKLVNGQPLENVFGYAMDSPSISNHIWQASLPKGISPGSHTVTIRTTDMYGQTWQASRVFRVR